MDANQWRKHTGDQQRHGMASITGIAGMAWAYNNTHLWKENENPEDLKWQQKSAEGSNIKLTESRASCQVKKHLMHVIAYNIHDTHTQSTGRMHDTLHSLQAYIYNTWRTFSTAQFRVQRAARSKQRERTSKNKKEEIYHYSESLFEHSLINKYHHVGWIDIRFSSWIQEQQYIKVLRNR